MKFYLCAVGFFAVLFTAPGCKEDNLATATVSKVKLGVDFGAGAGTSLQGLLSTASERFSLKSTQCSPPVEGCSVVYQTPTQYNIALKSVFLNTQDGQRVYLFDHDSLADISVQTIFSFDSSNNSPIQLDLPVGLEEIAGVEGIGFEVYYIEVELIVYGEARLIRIYMSDDDFAHHGGKGHHQGDITYFEDGNEYWARGGGNWFKEQLSTRGVYADGAGGADPETGHGRGMFGDGALWNSPEFAQGPSEDIFVLERGIEGVGSSLMLTFDVTDTWSFEDYDGDGSFDPCEAEIAPYVEACSDGAHWHPVFPVVSVLN